MNTTKMTRREMLAGAGMLLLLPMLAARSQADDAPAPIPPPAPQWVDAGPVKTLELNQPRENDLPNDGGVFYVARVKDAGGKETFVAYSAKCSHRGCKVGWKKDAGQFQCPCHGAAFAPDGKNLHGTQRHPDEALPPLTPLPVRQAKDRLEVNIGAVTPESLLLNGG